jgi:hypothetical protein
MAILLNHVGFPTRSAKYALHGPASPPEFVVQDYRTGKTIVKGVMQRVEADLGHFLVGDFSSLQIPGKYTIWTKGAASYGFVIGDDVYDDALSKMAGYFAAQRCGDTTGKSWSGPCHLDDARRNDNGQIHRVVGGWHDACDLRKWVNATLLGMVGLLRLAKHRRDAHQSIDDLIDELRWGNRYFLAMQEPAGYVMDHIGGNPLEGQDRNNRWTDNLPDSGDERAITTTPVDSTAQGYFVFVQAELAMLMTSFDRDYALQCQDAAKRCMAWIVQSDAPKLAGEIGAAAAGCVSLHRVTNNERWLEQAATFADELIALQSAHSIGSISGYFARSATDPEPFREPFRGCWIVIGLCELLRESPAHTRAGAWKDSLQRFIFDCIAPLAKRNAFGIVPYGVYRAVDPYLGRPIGEGWYRYFMDNKQASYNNGWRVGLNPHLASMGVALCLCADVLGDHSLRRIAQRQLDWIMGVNPFNASTITGVGRNQPDLFINLNGYRPPTPEIPGGVYNGIRGDEDQPQLKPGSWVTCEYWTPNVVHTMWLMVELLGHETR